MIGLGKYAAILSFAFIAAALTMPPKKANAQGFDSRTGHYYNVHGFSGEWHAVSRYAQSQFVFGRPGHLVTIKDSIENSIVQNLVDHDGSLFGEGAKWLGGYDLSIKQNKWQWITNDLFTYTNWSPGEPNGPSSETVLEMRAFTGGQWNDIAHNTLTGGRGKGVIEFEPSQVTVFSMTGPTLINSPRAVNYTVTLAAPSPPGGAILFMHSSAHAIRKELPNAISIPAGSSSFVVSIVVDQIVAPNQVGYVRVYGKNKKSLTVTVTP